MRNEKILSLAAIFLERHADELSNAGCNDLDSEMLGEISNDWLDEINRWDRCDFDKIERVPDWLLARFVSFKLKQMANEQN